jgi:hypothetical protein
MTRDAAYSGPNATAAAVSQGFLQNYTFVANTVPKRWPVVRELCAQMQAVTGLRVGGNLYVTPMSAPSGFDPHWDGHGVLVMQLEGSKQWTLFDGVHGPSLLPRPPMQKVVTAAELGASRDVVLHPGTVMFLPTGKIHKAKPVRVSPCGFDLDLLHTPSGLYHLIIGSLPKLNKPLRGLKVKAFQSCPKGLPAAYRAGAARRSSSEGEL